MIQGEQIEYINNYNLIGNVVNDYTMGEAHKKTIEAVLAGGSPDGNPDNAPEVAGANATSEADGSSLILKILGSRYTSIRGFSRIQLFTNGR